MTSMADEEHVSILKQSVEMWNAWRYANNSIRPNLAGTNLKGANLHGADLEGANLEGTNLEGANLEDANLAFADLDGANLEGANLEDANLEFAALDDANLKSANLEGANLKLAGLRGANLAFAALDDANLESANLEGANLEITSLLGAVLRDADLRRVTLIDSFLNYADLTGAKLWETQRSGWSIKSITCRQAFWDRDGKEPTKYEDGEFERIFAEKPRIVLRYPGGMSLVDIAMLPLIVERLQAEHPNCVLHIRSVQDDGSAAAVTITVNDLAGRSNEAFAQDVNVLRSDLITLQHRLQQEERLRLEFEAKYSAVVQDILPKLLERALPRTEVHVGQITGPTIMGSRQELCVAVRHRRT
jgi:hypothetical protein